MSHGMTRDNFREDFDQQSHRAQSDAIISLVIGLVCCSPLGLVLSIRALNRTNSLLSELQTTPEGAEFMSRASGAKIIAIAAIVMSAVSAVGTLGWLSRPPRLP